MGARPILHGPAYSVYVRAARMALLAKGVPFDFASFDILGDWENEEWRRLHPFDRVPVLETAYGVLCETAAITHFVDDGFDGPPLQPSGAWKRARMNQAIGIADSYVYGHWVHGLGVERVVNPGLGRDVDEEAVAAVLPACLRAADALCPVLDELHVEGYAITLADIHLAPMAAYATASPEGAEMIRVRPSLAGWWGWMQQQSSFQDTDVLLGRHMGQRQEPR